MEIERRIVDVPCEVRCECQEGGKKRHIITGYAATFGTESRMLPGGFVETINKGAFDEVLATNPDVVGVYNHDKNYLLGRTANGTMKLSVDARGLKYEIWAPESRADVIESIERGDVVGSSFAFKVPRGFESWGENERGIRKRSIDKVGVLEDVGPVVRPAYGSATVIVSRRAIEEAVGEAFRPNQTMANAAKRGLKLASGREGVDQSLFPIAERLQQREIVSPEEVGYLAATHQRLAELRSSSWNGTPAWVEYQLAGGESGEKWLARRMESPVFAQDEAESRAENELSEPPEPTEEPSAGELSPQNYDLFEAIKQIATREGPWSQDAADGAHYLPDSPFAEQGIKCENCIFWNAENNCDVVDGEIAPSGICKLWAIPEDRMIVKEESQPTKLEEPPPAEPPMAKRSDVDAALTAAARLKAQSLEAAAIGRA
jgi:HK97 family phage prohead protease